MWNTRFHRKDAEGACQTKDWIFFISRPTLETLRKTDQEGKIAHEILKNRVEAFLAEGGDASPGDAHAYSGNFKLKTYTDPRQNAPSSTEERWYCTVAYPFDISNEVQNKVGVVFHIGNASESRSAEREFATYDQKSGYPNMFDRAFQQHSNDECPRPPGVEQANPMWNDFASSKMLPVDQLLELERGRFRNIISHQYIEVRLVKDRSSRTLTSSEQIETLLRFESFSSGFANFSGPPGTGKSTLLHMICAHNVFLSYIESQNQPEPFNPIQIMYYVHSSDLSVEAEMEIGSILTTIYAPAIVSKYPEAHGGLKKLMKQTVHFSSQESLALVQSTPPAEYNVVRETSNDNLDRDLGLYKDRQTRVVRRELLKRGLRSLVFGIFGTVENYPTWSEQNKTIWRNPVDFIQPNSNRSAQNHNLTLDAFLTSEANAQARKKQIEDFTKMLKRLEDDGKIWNGEGDKKYWDSTALIHHTSMRDHPPNSIWSKLKNRVGLILIDEVQDISLTEIRILLRHFANRDGAQNRSYCEFKLVCAGDENQNVNHLFYKPQNRHYGHIYQNWVQLLRLDAQGTMGDYPLSHNLNSMLEVVLKSGYRVFNEMIVFANNIIEELERQYIEKGQRRGNPTRLERTEFGRNGLLLCANHRTSPKAKERPFLADWERAILEAFKRQLYDSSQDPPTFQPDYNHPVRVALTYTQDDVDAEFQSDWAGSPFTTLLQNNNQSYSSEFAEQLDGILTSFTQQFRAHEEGQPTMEELLRVFRLRGVINERDIKGRTVPVCIVIPPKNLVKGESQANMNSLSGFLVQMTRAQYVNVLVEDTRNIGIKGPITTNLDKQDFDGLQPVTSWLENILENASGIDDSLSSLFTQTIVNYESDTLWEKLNLEANQSEDQQLENIVQWLEQFHKALLKQPFTINTWKGFLHVGKNEKILGIKKDSKKLPLAKLEDVMQEYLLGDLFDHLPGLNLFVAMNAFFRTVDTGDASTYYTRLDKNDFESAIDAWLNWLSTESEDNMAFEQEQLRDWFELLKHPTADLDNEISRAIDRLFDDSEAPHWPDSPQPRLYLGNWRLTDRTEGKTDEQGDLEKHAWMIEDSAYFNIRPEVLDWMLSESAKSKDGYEDKIRLFLGMTSINSTIFVNALTQIIGGQRSDRHHMNKILDWYVRMFTTIGKHEDFKEEVRKKLESQIKSRQIIKTNLTAYLGTAQNIQDLENKLEAFGFEDWKGCILGKDMFQHAVEMAHNAISPTVEAAHRNQQVTHLNSMKGEKNADLLNFERIQAEHQHSRREKFRDVVRESTTLTTMGVSMDELIALVDEDKLDTNPSLDRFIETHQAFKDISVKIEMTKSDILSIDRDINALKREQDVTTASTKFSDIENPFRKGTNIHDFFKAQLTGDNDLHLAWFNLLWGLDGFQGVKDFAYQHQEQSDEEVNPHFSDTSKFRSQLMRFPAMDTEFKRKFHVCVDAYCNANSEEIDSLVNRCTKPLRIDPKTNKVVEHPIHELIIILLDSLKKAYTSEDVNVAKVFPHRQVLKENSPSERWNDNLYERLYRGFMGQSGKIRSKFMIQLSGGDAGRTHPPSHIVQQYFSSPFGRLVYASLNHEFIEQAQADSMLNRWKHVTSTRGSNLLDFIEKHAANQRQKFKTLPQPEKSNRIMHHRSMLGPEQRSLTLEEHLANGAAFAAFAHLADDEVPEAIERFNEAGWLDHAAALSLWKAYSPGQDSRYELVHCLVELLQQEENQFLRTLYTGRKGFNQMQYDHNKAHAYGLGPMSDERDRRTDAYVSLRKHLSGIFQNEKLTVNTKNERTEEGWVLPFFEHATYVAHAEIWRQHLEKMSETEDAVDAYLNSVRSFWDRNASRFTMFRKDEDSRHLYTWKWLNKGTNNGRKPGYMPSQEFEIFNGKESVMSFLEVVLNRNPVMSDDEFATSLQTLTGVKGHTLACINPSRAHTPLEEQQGAIVEAQETRQSKLLLKERMKSLRESRRYANLDKTEELMWTTLESLITDEAFDKAKIQITIMSTMEVIDFNDKMSLENDIDAIMQHSEQ